MMQKIKSRSKKSKGFHEPMPSWGSLGGGGPREGVQGPQD